ncbi:helix-turn-helix transcriptional regulator [Saccharothrix algeriensis]|uniref:DNA-binding NarL/FixJ family response regulator n=4 Tax=Saccharothrix algeriensis TaxID=173560 RepID=A0ABS2RZ28_9PSEU|nr:LuxR family transcriptional regulator [Saccharothrix algeriensis]MBM7809251.1 DNA-binding NarL/FixJ family response regulator [Saccharothrix algeriensis]
MGTAEPFGPDALEGALEGAEPGSGALEVVRSGPVVFGSGGPAAGAAGPRGGGAGLDASALLDGARGSGVRLVRVVGGAGAGKSRLLDELVRGSRHRRLPALAACGTEAGRAVPFGTLRDALRDSPDTGAGAPAAQDALLLLRAVFHSLLAAERGTSTLLAAERHRLYRTVADLVAALARPAGLLVAVDDAHLADPGSRELLGHLLRHPPEADLLLVVAHPPGAVVPPDPPDGVDGPVGHEVVELGAPPAAAAPVLPPADLLVARAAAVLGGAEPGLVAAVAGTTLHEARAALVRLAAAGRGRPPGSLLDAADGRWVRRAHARAARVLAEDGAPVTARAHHVARSARPGDLDAVADLVAAADAASRVAPAVAVGLLEAARALLPRGATSARSRVLRRLVAAAEATGRPNRRAIRELLDLRPADRADVALRCALSDRAHGRHAEANALLERELRGRADARGRVLLELGLAADPAAGHHRADRVLAAARALGDDAALVSALAVRQLGPARDPALLDEAAARADRLADCPAQALLWLGRAETALERPADALRHLDRAPAVARAGGRDDLVVPLAEARGAALEHLGRLAEAHECYADAAESAFLSGAAQARSRALAGRARIAVWRGDAAEGRRLAERAVAAHPTLPAHFALALALLHTGDPARCTAQLLAAGGGPDLPLVEPPTAVRWCALLALADGALGRTAAAARWAERAAALTAGLPAGLRRAHAHVARAGALGHGSPAEAAVHAVRAARAFEGAGEPVHAGRARLVAAALFRRTGPTTGARRARRERARARALLDACEPGLADRLAGAWPPGAPAGHGLTDRELAVLGVLAEGLTADAIARRMDISPRTVHRHLQHLYRKLGTTDRLSAVLRAQSLGLLPDAPAAVPAVVPAEVPAVADR